MRLVLLAACTLTLLACGGSDPPPAPAGPGSSAVRGLGIDPEDWRTDFTRHTVPLDEFWAVVPRGGIPALDRPSFVSVVQARAWLEAREPVIELVVGGEARAYPLQILIWHELANDVVGDVPVAVTFCPLCHTALVFDRRVDGRTLEFEPSGVVRNSDLVMVDRQTETWWQQFGGAGVVGELAGRRLVQVPAAVVAFEDFATRHPDGAVLSRFTGYDRPYGLNPYGGYDRLDRPSWYKAANADDGRLLPKERVVYLERGADTVVVPFSVLERRRRLQLTVGGEPLEVRWLGGVRTALGWPTLSDAETVGAADVRSLETGRRVAFDTPFWFAVAAFRPEARIVR